MQNYFNVFVCLVQGFRFFFSLSLFPKPNTLRIKSNQTNEKAKREKKGAQTHGKWEKKKKLSCIAYKVLFVIVILYIDSEMLYVQSESK